MKIIIYNQNGIKVIIPFMDVDIKIIADKDVPFGIPYLIIDDFILPSEPQETWEVDFSNSDGIGLTKKEFEAKYPEYKGMAVQ
jgi:hypothetical protein